MHKLLIAGGAEEFQTALERAMGPGFQVCRCATGKEALALLDGQRWDALVLELTLPELDGISLLKAACPTPPGPRVLALTPFVNDYILMAARELGVDYLIRLPCDVRAVAARVADLLRDPRPVQAPRARSSALLHQLGVPTKLDGYAYLREAIVLAAEKPGQSVTKVLYPTVAARFGCTGRQVERSIRNALDVAWKRRDPPGLAALLPPPGHTSHQRRVHHPPGRVPGAGL